MVKYWSWKKLLSSSKAVEESDYLKICTFCLTFGETRSFISNRLLGGYGYGYSVNSNIQQATLTKAVDDSGKSFIKVCT